MSSDVEQIVEKRQRILRKLMYGIPLGFGSLALQDALPASWRGLHALAALPSFVGIPLLLVGAWQMYVLSQRLKADKHLAGIVNDERTQANGFTAAAFGLCLLFGINGLVIALSQGNLYRIPAVALAEFNEVVGISASLALFLHLDGKE